METMQWTVRPAGAWSVKGGRLTGTQLGPDGAEHENEQARGGERGQNRSNSERAWQDEPRRAQHFGETEQLHLSTGRVAGPSHACLEPLARLQQLRQARGEKQEGETALHHPQCDVHVRSPPVTRARSAKPFGPRTGACCARPRSPGTGAGA